MTRGEIQALDSTDLNLRLAVTLGWKNVYFQNMPAFTRRGYWVGEHPEDRIKSHIPFYSDDLNECQDAESTLTSEQWLRYIDVLFGNSAEWRNCDLIKEPETWNHRIVFIALNFTARQRAESLLWVLTGGAES
jgi:hypothetical protein